SYFVQLWWAVDPLVNGSQYEVDVRAMVGGNWCEWGDICTLTIEEGAGALRGNQQNMHAGDHSPAELTIEPNPHPGRQLYLSLTQVPEGALTVSVDMFDLFGKRVIARTIAAQDGNLNTVIDLEGQLAAGMYMVNITAGDKTYTQRLVVQP